MLLQNFKYTTISLCKSVILVAYYRISSDITNAACSADELLCDELDRAEYTYISGISHMLEDCSSRELMIIADTIQTLKASLRK